MATLAVLVVFLLVVLNGLFAMTEMALVSSRRGKLQARADRGDKGAKLALALSENPTHFLSAVQVGITLIGILAGAYGQATIAGALDQALERYAPLAPYSEALSTAVVVIGITYVSLIVGELVPKRIALLFPETLASRAAPPISAVAKLLSPFVWLLTLSTAAVLRLFRIKDDGGSEVTQEEVETILAEGTSAGLIEPGEQEIIEEVMRLGDRAVRVAMTPRPEVWWISLDDPLEITRQEIRGCPYSRIVVSRGTDVENPVGVLHKKDVLDAILDGGELNLESLTQQPIFIPETTSVLKALERFKQTPVHMAFVVDEFGAFQGVVTATDLLEMIAGDFPETHDEQGGVNVSPIQRRDDGSWLVDGRADVEELCEALEEDLVDEGEGFHTAAGLVLHVLSRIPAEGEVFRVGRYQVEVIDMDDRRIDKLIFREIRRDSEPTAEAG